MAVTMGIGGAPGGLGPGSQVNLRAPPLGLQSPILGANREFMGVAALARKVQHPEDASLPLMTMPYEPLLGKVAFSFPEKVLGFPTQRSGAVGYSGIPLALL